MNLSNWADAHDRNGELEPSLEALLSDSIAADLMRADRVTAKDIKAVVLKAGQNFQTWTSSPTETAGRREARPGEAIGFAWLRDLGSQDDSALLELGLRPDQVARLRAIGGAPPEGELRRMATHIGVDPESTPLPVRAELLLNCATCAERRLCRSWLAVGEDRAGYRVFCPNSRMLELMLHIQNWQGGPC